jgi:mannose-1-phosphate guanylyltransferase
MDNFEIIGGQKFIAGATVRAGQVCVLQADGKVYPGNSFLTAVGFASHPAKAGELVTVGFKADWRPVMILTWSGTKDSAG